MKTEPTEKEKLIEGLEVEISNCQDDLDAAPWAYEEGILISKREAAALLDLAQSSPKIKQLEWKKSGGEYWEAITPIGAYSITLDFGIYEALYDMDNDVDGEWGSLAKAKAAVQADFEKRVRECLE